ncbi:MAG: hypothetical protein EU530_05625 [Promethearchaeota archaeon]|nr:MAG: hypothetical protein EU530_05625 [Candidatus Lokiarchaeota archaeon]
MASGKETVESILKSLPDDATLEDILYEIYVQQNIKIGLDAIRKGDLISEDDAAERLKRWSR